MSSSPPFIAVPKRLTLSGQTADILRTAIAARTWSEYLPSERRLCEMFQISRPTVRAALHLLAQEGLIQIQQGRRNRLLASSPHSPRTQSRLVGLVTSEPVSRWWPVAYQGVSEMRAHLLEQGFGTEVLHCPVGSPSAQRRKLEEFVRQNRLIGCILFAVNMEIQQWFSRRAIPTLVVGSCHPEVKLPSLDVDQRSVCRHAAGIFLSRGHSRLALVLPDSGAAGDLASEQGFLEAIGPQSSTRRTCATVVRHNGTGRQIRTKLDALFRSAEPPTALLVAKVQHAFIVLMYLLTHGLTVPDRVSFIARDQDHVFKMVDPAISHYRFADDALSHRLTRLMLQMVSQGHLAPEPNLIFPRFYAGGTVRSI